MEDDSVERSVELDAPERTARVLERDVRLGDVVRAALTDSVETLLHCDAQLRLHGDEEAVHHARVAVRRLRSDLRSFLSVLDAASACALRERLAWLQTGLSEARDADVLIAGLQRRSEVLPAADRRRVDAALAPFRAARERAYGTMRAMLREPRYLALLDDLVATAKNPPFLAAADDAACDAIPAIVRDAWSAVRKRVRRCSRPPADRELHAVRIAAKRLRYVVEAATPVAGRRGRAFAHAVEQLQTVLGEQHDAVAACARLHDAHAGEDAFVIGELAALEWKAALDARAAWPKAWRKAKRAHRRFEMAP